MRLCGTVDSCFGQKLNSLLIAEDEIIDLCERTIANYKKLQPAEFVQQLPKSTTRKILKRLIRARVKNRQ